MAGCQAAVLAASICFLVAVAQAQAPAPAPGVSKGVPGYYGSDTLPWNKNKLNLLKNAVEISDPAFSPSPAQSPSLSKAVTTFLTPTSTFNAATPGATTTNGLLIYTPTNAALNAADLGVFIQNCYANSSIPGVALTAGTYTVNNPDPNAAFHVAVYCSGRTNNAPFEISFSGSTFYFGDKTKGGIALNFCNKVNFHGPFNFMYTATQLPFTQGTLTAVVLNPSTGVSTVTVQIDTGYPTTGVIGDGQSHLCVAYETNGKLVLNATDIYTIGAATSLGGQLYQFQAYISNTVTAGKRLAIRGNVGQHGFSTYTCSNVIVSQVYLYTAGIFGFLDTFGYNTTFLNNVIQPWPFPIGNTVPLISTNADGMHSVAPLLGPTMSGNTMLSCGDDALAIHGLYMVVAATNADTNTLTVGTFNCNDPVCLGFAPGDTIYLYAPVTYQFIGSAVISTITYQPVNPVPGRGPSQNYPAFNFDTAQYFDFVLTSFPPGFSTAPVESLIATPDKTGNQFKVVNNYAGNNRARGFYIKASNGIIANNVISQPSNVGLLMSPDPYFLEGDFVRNVVISGNYISATFGNVQQGSFDLFANPTPSGNHNNISYTGNTFVNGAYAGIVITSTTNLKFSGNAISTAGCYPFVNGLYYPFYTAGTLIYNAYIYGASIFGNGFQQSGCLYGNYQTPFTVGYTVDQYKFF